MNLRYTPRERVAMLLAANGIQCYAEDIWIAQGYWTHMVADVTERWCVKGTKDGERVEVTGIDSLTLCQKGIVVTKATENDGVYGDYVCAAKRN